MWDGFGLPEKLAGGHHIGSWVVGGSIEGCGEEGVERSEA